MVNIFDAIRNKIQKGHTTTEQKQAEFEKQRVQEQAQKEKSTVLDRLNVCKINTKNPASFEKMLRRVDPEFMKDGDVQEILKDIVKASNNADNPEVNAFVLDYIKNAARITKSPEVLKSCYALCALDLETKKELGKDMNKPENLKAMSVLEAGLLNRNNDIFSYGDGYYAMNNCIELSDSAREKSLNFLKSHPMDKAMGVSSQMPARRNSKGVIEI